MSATSSITCQDKTLESVAACWLTWCCTLVGNDWDCRPTDDISRHVYAFLPVEADEDNPRELSWRVHLGQGAGVEPPAPLLRRVTPCQEVGAAPPVDLQVHAGVLQAGGQGEGAGPGVLAALWPTQHHGPSVSDWWVILSLCGRWSYRLLLLPGFIDFIVIPTLSTCGEMIATVLGTSAADFQQPWSETLLQNRNNWQKKVSAGENVQFQCMTTQADEGERGIDTSDASQDPRPPRASYSGCKHKPSVSTKEPE